MKRIVVAGLVTYALLVVGYSAQAGVGPDLKCKDAKGKAAALKGLALMKAVLEVDSAESGMIWTLQCV